MNKIWKKISAFFGSIIFVLTPALIVSAAPSTATTSSSATTAKYVKPTNPEEGLFISTWHRAALENTPEYAAKTGATAINMYFTIKDPTTKKDRTFLGASSLGLWEVDEVNKTLEQVSKNNLLGGRYAIDDDGIVWLTGSNLTRLFLDRTVDIKDSAGVVTGTKKSFLMKMTSNKISRTPYFNNKTGSWDEQKYGSSTRLKEGYRADFSNAGITYDRGERAALTTLNNKVYWANSRTAHHTLLKSVRDKVVVKTYNLEIVAALPRNEKGEVGTGRDSHFLTTKDKTVFFMGSTGLHIMTENPKPYPRNKNNEELVVAWEAINNELDFGGGFGFETPDGEIYFANIKTRATDKRVGLWKYDRTSKKLTFVREIKDSDIVDNSNYFAVGGKEYLVTNDALYSVYYDKDGVPQFSVISGKRDFENGTIGIMPNGKPVFFSDDGSYTIHSKADIFKNVRILDKKIVPAFFNYGTLKHVEFVDDAIVAGVDIDISYKVENGVTKQLLEVEVKTVEDPSMKETFFYEVSGFQTLSEAFLEIAKTFTPSTFGGILNSEKGKHASDFKEKAGILSYIKGEQDADGKPKHRINSGTKNFLDKFLIGTYYRNLFLDSGGRTGILYRSEKYWIDTPDAVAATVTEDSIEFSSDDKHGILTIIFKANGKRVELKVPGFRTLEDDVDDELAKNVSPTIATGSENKIADNIVPSDLQITSSTPNATTVSIDSVTVSTTTADGTTATVTIKVASKADPSIFKTYAVELGGFISYTDAAAGLVGELTLNDLKSFFTTAVKAKYPSLFTAKADILNRIKTKSSFTKNGTLVNVNSKVLDLIVLGDIVLTPDNTAGTLKVEVQNHGPAKQLQESGFRTLEDDVDEELAKNVSPTIATGSENKIADNVVPSDLQITSSTPNATTVSIDSVTVSTTTADGTTATVTIKVASKADPSIFKTYTIELGGFTSYTDAAAGLVGELTLNDINSLFTTVVKAKYPSLFTAKADILNRIKTKSSFTKNGTLVNVNSKVLDLIVLGDIVLTPDNTAGTLKVEVQNHGPAKQLQESGFRTLEDDVDEELAKNVSPTIATGSENKIADNVVPSDLQITSSTPSTTTVSIDSVTVSTTTADGTTATVTIKVASKADPSIFKTYTVELGGFISYTDAAAGLVGELTLNDIHSLFTATVKSAKPSAFTNQKAALLNLIKQKTSFTKNGVSVKVNNKVLSLILLTNINVAPDDNHGTLSVEISGHGSKKVLVATGFLNNATQQNADVDKQMKKRLLPKLLSGKSDQIGDNVSKNDFELVDPNNPNNKGTSIVINNTTVSIHHVETSSKTPGGTTVTLTIKVASVANPTVYKTYEVEQGGFISYVDAAKGLIQGLTLADINSLFTPSVKSDFPSNFMQVKVFVDKIKTKSSYTKNGKTVDVNENVFDLITANNISLKSDNNKGTLTIEISGHGTKKVFLATGFLTNSNSSLGLVKRQVNKKLAPVIKGSSNIKISDEATVSDFELVDPNNPNNKGTKITIGQTEVSIESVTTSSKNPDGTTTTIKIRVASKKDPKIFLTYELEVGGFISYEEAAKGLVQELALNDISSAFNASDKAKHPSSFKGSADILNQIKQKASFTKNGVVVRVNNKVHSLIVPSNIELVSDDKSGELNVLVKGHGQNKQLKETGFRTLEDDVTDEVNKKGKPTIIPGFENEIADNVIAGDLQITSSTPNRTISSITGVAVSTTTKDGTTVAVTVKVVSIKDPTVFKTYTVEVSGFMPYVDAAEGIVQELSLNDINSIFTATDKAKFPSTFTNKAGILASIKGKTSFTKNGRVVLVGKKVTDLIKLGDITLVANDINGTLKVIIKGHGIDKEIVVYGFLNKAQQFTDNVDKQVKARHMPGIKSSNNNKIADEATVSDFEFTVPNTTNKSATLSIGGTTVSIESVELSSKTPDGSTSTVTIKVTSNDDPTIYKFYEVEVTGFKTYQQSANSHIQSLLTTDFNFTSEKNTLASRLDKSKVELVIGGKKFKGKKIHTKIHELIISSDIKLTSDDKAGALTVVISNHGTTKTLTFTGFKTMAALEKEVEDDIKNAQKLLYDLFPKKTSYNNKNGKLSGFPTADKVTTQDVDFKFKDKILEKLKQIKSRMEILGLKGIKHVIIEVQKVEPSKNVTDGSTVTVTLRIYSPELPNHKVAFVTEEVSGFKTYKKAAEDLVQNLDDETFAGEKEPTVEYVLHKIWNQKTNGNDPILKLISEKDITLTKQPNGDTLALIKNHGEDKTIRILKVVVPTLSDGAKAGIGLSVILASSLLIAMIVMYFINRWKREKGINIY